MSETVSQTLVPPEESLEDEEQDWFAYQKSKKQARSITAGIYLRDMAELHRSEQDMYWRYALKQHYAIQKALDFDSEELHALYQSFPKLSHEVVWLLDVPTEDRNYFYQLNLEKVFTPEEQYSLLIVVRPYKLKKPLKSFNWGDNLGLLESERVIPTRAAKEKQLGKLGHMSSVNHYETTYTTILSKKLLAGLCSVLRLAVSKEN